MSSTLVDHPNTGLASPLALTPRWRRLLVPSLSDLFFLFITAWMFLSSPVGWDRLLLDADTALHTRIGQTILASGAVLHQDPFSFAQPGQPWYAFEWLSETIFAAVFQLASYKGLVLLAGMLIACYLTMLLKYTLWRGANGLVALVVLLMTATASSVHFHARPHLFTLLLLTGALWLLEYNRQKGGLALWLLVPMLAIWTNLHGGFFLFFAMLGVRLAGCVAEAVLWSDLRAARRKEALQLGGLAVACGLASLLNPYGIGLHLHIVETLSSPWIMANVKEFLSPTFRGEEMTHYMLLLFAAIACLAPLVRRRNLVEPLGILLLAYASLTSVRHVPLFTLVAAPVIAVEISAWWRTYVDQLSRTSWLGILDAVSQTLTARLPGTSVFIPLVIAALALAPDLNWPRAFPDGAGLPVALIERHADLLATGRLFAPDQIADYLIFRNAPRQKVFFDSRHNYYEERLRNEYLALSSGGPAWRQLLARYRFTTLLIETGSPLHSLVATAGGWRRIDKDDKFSLWERMP